MYKPEISKNGLLANALMISDSMMNVLKLRKKRKT